MRFISLGDGYDSARPEDADSLTVSFSTILYDLYSKELSEKVRDAKDRLARKGDCLAAAAPFGYAKDPNRPKHLIVDPVAGKTVAEIFTMACNGQGTGEIAQILNDKGNLTPMCYKQSKGTPWPGKHITEENFWTASMVAKIIRDERYTGCTIYGKRRRDMAAKCTVKVPREQWIITEGAHEALVSKERFREAQSMLRNRRERSCTASASPLAKKVYCGCCGRAMARSSGKQVHYYCKTLKFTDRFSCAKDTVPERDVIGAVQEMVQVYVRLTVDGEALLVQQRKQAEKTRKHILRERMAGQSRRVRTEQKLRTLYERFAEGIIGKEEYVAQKQTLFRLLHTTSESAEQAEGQDKFQSGAMEKLLEGINRIAEENIRDLVDRITIYPGKTLDVRLRLCDELK